MKTIHEKEQGSIYGKILLWEIRTNSVTIGRAISEALASYEIARIVSVGDGALIFQAKTSKNMIEVLAPMAALLQDGNFIAIEAEKKDNQ
jgi:hypothetical protein